MQAEVRCFSLIKKVISRTILACVVSVFLFAFFFPVYAGYFMGDTWAYRSVLRAHQFQSFVYNRVVSEREPCLLYLSWFPDGKPAFARTYAVGASGTTQSRRVMWNYATQGSGGMSIEDQRRLNTLEQLAALPPGLEDPNDVSWGRLLIVSSGLRGRWVTRYYDRAHLPAPIGKIVQLLNLDLSTRYQSF